MRGLVPCPSCACHVRAGEPRCPHCGVSFARARCDPRSGAAILLGLSATLTFAVDGCGPDVTGHSGVAGSGGTSNNVTIGANGGSSVYSTYATAPSAGPGINATLGAQSVCDVGDC